MGKRKKKNKKYKYNKEEFCTILCSYCSVCEFVSNSNFCYDYYKINGKRFIKKVYPAIKNMTLPENPFVQITWFQSVFCSFCSDFTPNNGDVCLNLQECFSLFKEQVDPVYTKSLSLSNFKKPNIIKRIFNGNTGKNHTKTKKERYVVGPYMTFFCSDNEEWKNTLRKLHDNSDNK
jgi:hypothetical protein